MHIRAKVDEDRVYFCNGKVPKVGKPHKCLTMIRLESISVTKTLKCYPQIFLQELKINNRRNARMGRNAFDESDVVPESDVEDDEFTVEKLSKKCKNPFMKTDNNDNDSDNNDNN